MPTNGAMLESVLLWGKASLLDNTQRPATGSFFLPIFFTLKMTGVLLSAFFNSLISFYVQPGFFTLLKQQMELRRQIVSLVCSMIDNSCIEQGIHFILSIKAIFFNIVITTKEPPPPQFLVSSSWEELLNHPVPPEAAAFVWFFGSLSAVEQFTPLLDFSKLKLVCNF